MDLPVRRSNILTLQGVFIKDLVRLDAPTIIPETQNDIVYTDMPRRFTRVGIWPQHSNLRCWECDQVPDGYPKFIPSNIEEDADGEHICDVYGHFCQWGCAVRFVINEYQRESQWDTLYAICLFESKFSGDMKIKIPPAPPKTLMKPYCGNSGITLRQWHEKLILTNKEAVRQARGRELD